MTSLKVLTKRNDTARLFQQTSKIHRNCCRFNVGNTIEHELKKFRMCWAFKKAEEEFITEAVFTNGLRADIVNLDQGIIFEIINSESEESIHQKEINYPLELRKVYVK